MPRTAARLLGRLLLLAGLAALTLTTVAPAAPEVPSDVGPGSTAAVRPPIAWESTVTLVADRPGETRLRFEITDGGGASRDRAMGDERPGAAAVDYRRPRGGGRDSWRARSLGEAAFTLLVRVADRGAVEAIVESATIEPIGAAAGPEPDGSSFVKVGPPGIMRDLRLVRVTFAPFAAAAEGAMATSLDVTLRTTDRPGLNEKRRTLPTASPAFQRLYDAAVINAPADPPDADGGPRDPLPIGARYLVITYDSFASGILPLAEWKHLKGMQAKVTGLSSIGSSPAQIRNYIETAYMTWELPPEYVLLVGDTEILPSYDGLTSTDNYYAAIDGSDYLADVMVGRISADSPGDVATQVAKILGYERTPITDDPDWPASATLMIADDFDAGDWVYYANTWFIYDLMESSALAPIDTLFRRDPISMEDVYDSVNAGRGFLNYRGQAWFNWLYEFDIDPNVTTNGWKLPVVVSATCATGIFYTDGFVCEEWVRAGTAASPRGGVAFFGTNTALPGSEELALRRGYVDEGFFANAFGEDGLTLGEACLAGKLNLYIIDEDQLDYEGWNLLGDPAMNLWTGDPVDLDVSHTNAVTIGPSNLSVHVSSGRTPVEGALVGCVKGTEVYAWGLTDASGHATISIEPASAGTLSVTVTARNGLPHEGSVRVIDSGPLLVYSDLSIDDAVGGNGDGLLSPGETAAISIALENIGTEVAESPVATLRTADAYATVADSVVGYADVAPDSIVWGGAPYTIAVDAGCPAGHTIAYSLSMAYASTTYVQSAPPIEIATGRLASPAAEFDDAAPGGDGDGLPDPGEVIGLVVTLTNEGPCDLWSVEGELSTDDPLVAVTSGVAAFGDAASGSAVANEGLPFVLSISPGAPAEHGLTLSLALTAEGGSYTYTDTVTLTVTIVGSPSTLPTGPDAHGYYAYDAGDSLHGPAPVYDWVEIAPPGPGTIMTDITDADAAVTTAPIFFDFRYYGAAYTQISVCSNGFVSMGVTDYRLGDNSAIPSGHGPPRMIAPFWDDLDPSAGGDIYKWYDVANHRFVVEFDGVRHWASPDEETFELILLDPDYYPTPTGDGRILMQYKSVENANECTVGIEDDATLDGIQYLYNGQYGAHAVPLLDGAALLFTTEPPQVGDLPWLVLAGAELDDDGGGNGNGVAEPGETISLVLGLENDGAVDAMGVTTTATCLSDAVSFSDSTAAYPDIPAGGSATNTSDALVFTVSSSPADTIATVWVGVEANGGGYAGSVRLDLRIDTNSSGVPGEGAHEAFALRPCRPNPFAAETVLSLTLPEPEHVSVRVYNLSGRLVRTLVEAHLPGGRHIVRWDGRDSTGSRVAGGVYFLTAEAGHHGARTKVVVLR